MSNIKPNDEGDENHEPFKPNLEVNTSNSLL
jgi:hypothetical protein